MSRLDPTDAVRRRFAVLTGRLEDLSALATAGQAAHRHPKTYRALARRLQYALQQLTAYAEATAAAAQTLK